MVPGNGTARAEKEVTSIDSLVLQTVTLALGVAASPLPIVAVLIILLTKRPRSGGLATAAGWVIGNAVAIAIALAFAATIPIPRRGTDLAAEGIFLTLLGIGLIVIAALSRRGRLRATGNATPAWVNAVDNLSPMGGALVAFANATTSPKNLALAITAGKLIGGSVARQGTQVAAVLAYVAVASVTVVGPVVVYLLGGQRSVDTLVRWRAWVTAHAVAASEIVLLGVGLAMSIKGIYNLLT